jgi:tellurite resistance protein TerC
VLHWAHSDLSPAAPEISTPVSLAVIAVVLAVTTAASLLKTRRNPATRCDRVSVSDAGGPADEQARQPR